MSEVFFVLKTLMITAAVTMLMQVHVGGASIEERANRWLIGSETAIWIQGAAAGGALAAKNLADSVKRGIDGTSSSLSEGAREQRAGR